MKWIFNALILMTTLTVTSQEFYFRQIPVAFDGDIQKIGLLFQRADQMIWMGTDQGLYSFDGKRYVSIKRPDRAKHEVTAIAERSNGELWVGYEDGYIQIISAVGHNIFMALDSLKGISISKILFMGDKDVFISTKGKGIWQWDENNFSRLSFSHLLNIDDVNDAILDAEDRLWLATDRGIWIYQRKPKEELRHLGREQGLPDEIVSKLLAGKNGDIWIGLQDHGLGRYLADRDSIISEMTIETTDDILVCLKQDQSWNTWMATKKSIVKYSNVPPAQKIQLPSGNTKPIEDLLVDNTGNLWIASGNNLFMANTQLEYHYPDVSEIQAITSLNEQLWLGCINGLYSMNKKDGVLTKHLQSEHLNVLSVYADLFGVLWIGTFDQGLYIYDPVSGRIKHQIDQDNVSNNSILNIDGSGRKLWLATLGGITEIRWDSDPTKDNLRIIDFQEKYNFPANYVYDVYVGHDGRVWFGTVGNSLYYLEQNHLYSFNRPIALPGQDSIDLRTIYSITGDVKNNLWISSTEGNILKFDYLGNMLEHVSAVHKTENSLITTGTGEIVMVQEGVIQIKSPAYGVYSYSTSAGLPSFSPNINAMARDKDGSVWIADTASIVHYIPSAIDTARYVHMHLVDIAPGNPVQPGTIQLKPDSNFLDLRFTGLWYPDPSKVQYRYMLQGHDQDWIYTKEGRAVYSKLSPGSYTFVIAGSYNDDFSQSIPLTRSIVVLTPYYKTWWFLFGIFLLILMVTYLLLRSRIRHINKLHQLEKEKTTLQLHAIQAQVNPHFLFNSFNTLSSIIEEDQKSAVAYVDQLAGFFRGVLMHREDELIPLEDEIIIMRNYGYILQKRYGDNIRIIEQSGTYEGYIAPLSIQLLVENAIKHNKVTSEKPLTIKIAIDAHWVVVSNPIQPKIHSVSESTGFGLSSLLTRYQYLTTSKIEILNDGNWFTVKIPIIHLNNGK